MQESVLKNYINKRVKGIYVTGYSESRENYSFFSKMPWWYFIEFEDSFLSIESTDTEPIKISTESEIQCNFDIEENDIFTVTSIDKAEYSLIIGFDLFVRKDNSNIYAFGVNFKDGKYILFDSLTWDGIKVCDARIKEAYQQDERFDLVKVN